MTHVITQNCCKDATCVPVCPVGCIHPAPDDPAHAGGEMLYIDPAACIDCGACVEACPVGAVRPADELAGPLARYAEINAAYFEAHPTPAAPVPIVRRPAAPPDGPDGSDGPGPLRVAVVGAGPSGFYAAEELLRTASVPVEVTMFDRLPTPFGLVRSGVAPDHPDTKAVTGLFRWTAAHPRFTACFNVEIGIHLSHDDVLRHHHAVLYTVGAADPRGIGIPGEDLPGSRAAADFVAWYNGHPDAADLRFDLGGRRVVIVGNGNVALDAARILLRDPAELAKTDIAGHALAALAGSGVEEVVLLGRRGPAEAACTTPELLALGHLDGVDVVVDPADLDSGADPGTFAGRLKTRVLAEFAAAPRRGGKRVVLKFHTSPLEIGGAGRVEFVRIGRNRVTDGGGHEPDGESGVIETGLVLRSVGYRGRPMAGLPFDEHTGTLPHRYGRVVDPASGRPVTGVYAAGWIKRGPSGGIGTNRICAAETVSALLADHAAGRLAEPGGSRADLDALLHRRRADRVDRALWQRLDEHELAQGRLAGRPRVKLTTTADMLRIAGLDG